LDLFCVSKPLKDTDTVIGSFRLDKTFKTTEPNSKPNTVKPTPEACS